MSKEGKNNITYNSKSDIKGQRRERFLQLAMGGILVVALPFFFLGGPGPTSAPLFPAVWNLGHVLFFAVLTVWLRGNFGPLQGEPGWLRLIFFMSAVLGVGVGIELVQYGFSRSPDWHDVWRNLLGAGAAWFFLARRSRSARVLLNLAGVLLGLELFLVGQVAWSGWRIQNQLPLLADMEREGDQRHWTGEVSRTFDLASHGTASLAVHLQTGLYSGTRLKSLARDWRGYHDLAFDIFNPAPETLRLIIRVNDRTHDQQGHRVDDRFNQSLLVASGWNHYRIPLADIEAAPSGRAMEMGDIFRLGLFAVNLAEPKIVYFDYFRLE